MKKYLAFSLVALFMSCQNQPAKDSTTSNQIELSLNWEFRNTQNSDWMPAKVPGTVHTDLLANGKIQDPFYRLNEKDQQWIDKTDWEYRTHFSITDDMANSESLELHFTGLDTYADIFVNDTLLLKANNMFRTWDIDIKKSIREGSNELRIYFHSPTKSVVELLEKNGYPLPAINDQSENGEMGDKKVSPFIRKAPYHYGWDWGPRLVTSGIWRPVYLCASNTLKLQSVFIRQDSITKKNAALTFILALKGLESKQVTLRIKDATTGEILIKVDKAIALGSNSIEIPLDIENPKLWWPNGQGEQNQYQFTVEVLDAHSVLATQTITNGLRRIRVVQDADSKGESFYFEVNGLPVFAKGANYIPNDNFAPRVSDEKYRSILQSAKDAHMNMIRVWGGGIYEKDIFYDLCDSLGLMVWQDFMFACSMYPGDTTFLNNVTQEAIENVQRLRNHPSIALWCGNNEIETAWGEGNENWGWGWKKLYNSEQRKTIYKSYDTLFYSILPKVVAENQPGAFYWSSSPSAGYKKLAGYEGTSGDMHYWGVWHGKENFDRFNEVIPRYMSEYGFQSFPDLASVKKYTQPEDWNIESAVMASHQRSGIGNLRIKEYMGWDYVVPQNFEHFLYVGQVLQAEGIKMGIEAHRRNKPYCMGTLYWQLNDCWPVASWSSIDYYGKWKALHYFVKKAYEPVALSIYNNKGTLEAWVLSDRTDSVSATLNLTLLDFTGKVMYQQSEQINIPAGKSDKYVTFPIQQLERKGNKSQMVLHAELVSDSKNLAEGTFYFVKPKEMQLQKASPEIRLLDNNQLEITSSVLIKNLFLFTDDEAVFSDNYFDVLPGEKQVISVNKKLNLKSIKTLSLADTY